MSEELNEIPLSMQYDEDKILDACEHVRSAFSLDRSLINESYDKIVKFLKELSEDELIYEKNKRRLSDLMYDIKYGGSDESDRDKENLLFEGAQMLIDEIVSENYTLADKVLEV